MYKPQYLNVERNAESIFGANKPYWTKNIVVSLGFKKKPPEKAVDKSGRRFVGKVR